MEMKTGEQVQGPAHSHCILARTRRNRPRERRDVHAIIRFLAGHHLHDLLVQGREVGPGGRVGTAVTRGGGVVATFCARAGGDLSGQRGHGNQTLQRSRSVGDMRGQRASAGDAESDPGSAQGSALMRS